MRLPSFVHACLLAALSSAVFSGCRDKAATASRQSQQAKMRQADRGEALLSAAASQLKDLPGGVNTVLKPPVVILDSRSSSDNKDVFAVCLANPAVPEHPNDVIQVPGGNGRFRALGVQSGDILKYFVLEDETVDPESRSSGLSRMLSLDLKIAQVIDDNILLIETGLKEKVEQPYKIEIWREVDDRLQEIHEKLSIYEIYRRPALGWEPAPDEQVLTQVMAWLNQWVRQRDPETDWKLEPLLDKLDAKLRADKSLEPYVSPAGLADRTFLPHEGRLLQEAIWLRDISRWARGERFDDVSRATALFDWTVRNIQLEAGDAAVPHRPWQTLLYSRGTAEQRAWVFAMLCRQQGLDVVILSVPAAGSDGKSAPKSAASNFWLPALLSEGKLYLFDARLGLPIPVPGGKGVATLDDVRKDDGLLRQLDIEGAAYPVTAASLKNIDIELVADPFSLARRALQIETNLTGDERVVLATRPSKLAARLKSISGVASVRLWDFPIKTLRDKLSLVKPTRHDEAVEFEPFAVRPALWKARTRHFQGRHQQALGESIDEKDKRPPDGYLSKTVRPTERAIAETTSENQRRVDSTTKLNSAYWIGLLSYDDGKFDVATSWLGRPDLTAAGSPWSSGANYNLARAWEAQSKFDEAIAILERDTGPQQHGNKIRARTLRARLKDAKLAK